MSDLPRHDISATWVKNNVQNRMPGIASPHITLHEIAGAAKKGPIFLGKAFLMVSPRSKSSAFKEQLLPRP
jgi:hypothetical protein